MTTTWSRTAWAALGLAWACTAAAQPVYKWVDAEGRTHYGSQLPTDQADAGQIKVSPNGSSGAGSGRFGEERNPDGTKKLPKQVREMADGVAKGLSKVDSKEVPLNCAAAVDNIRSQVDTMVENGQKNVKGGYITQAQFDATAGKFREARTHATVADCQASTGRSKAMYQCMSNSYNHLIGCAEKHKP
ncbi:DUF4124 domain-containing protein [Delftia sp. K82]|uniref:DUF4124 domain-containing protein n=1 Tax=Delftia TaxID=80865 RepID=UPI000B48E9BB|nr:MULTISPECIES: DUF4124 domain-containing protein [Delftia]MBD9582176.1 DUF4124 domain-containing protein [Delftia sp. DLF01]MCG3785359.1 DUF4124 domain-containing protein [Delftia acidovorans]OWG14726.1 DUF4124 domain-containing protein [Delftia sp. K82]